MPSQSDFIKVDKNFLDPLFKLYPKKPNEYQIEAITEDLAEYSDTELRAAALIIRRTKKFFPSIQESIDACCQARAQLRASNTSNQIATGGAFPWIQREERIQTLRRDYVKKYFNTQSAYAAQSLAEGWRPYLERYVSAVAFVQAQMLEQAPNTGFDAMAIFGSTQISRPEVDAWLQEQRNTVNYGGVIDVAIPMERVKEWKILGTPNPPLERNEAA